MRPTTQQRFDALHVPVPEAGCWLWEGRTHKGYGRIGIGRNKQFRAHRVAWELFVGPIPAGMLVLHKCDTPSCVNPAHLFLGDDKLNAEDRQAKGRGAITRNGGGWNRGIPHSVSHPNGSLGNRCGVAK